MLILKRFNRILRKLENYNDSKNLQDNDFPEFCMKRALYFSPFRFVEPAINHKCLKDHLLKTLHLQFSVFVV